MCVLLAAALRIVHFLVDQSPCRIALVSAPFRPQAFHAPALATLPDGWRQVTDGSGQIGFVNDRLQIHQVGPMYD